MVLRYLAMGLVLGMSLGASAQDVPEASDAPRAADEAESAPSEDEAAPQPTAEATATPTRRGLLRRRKDPGYWTGPRVELAYRVHSLSDSLGGGTVNSAVFSGFLPTRFFRGGGGVEAGTRAYDYGSSEGYVSGHVFAGYQHLRDLGHGRVVPYVVAIGELGVVFGKRFHTPQTRLLRGAGVELGADVNLVRSLYMGLGVGFMLYTMDDLAYDSFGLRLSIGL